MLSNQGGNVNNDVILRNILFSIIEAENFNVLRIHSVT